MCLFVVELLGRNFSLELCENSADQFNYLSCSWIENFYAAHMLSFFRLFRMYCHDSMNYYYRYSSVIILRYYIHISSIQTIMIPVILLLLMA